MKVKVLHQTDLFHYHCDPDDHWDLACQFALSYNEDIELVGVLIDYPCNADYGDPSIQAVNQLNYITCQSVPVGVGISTAIHSEKDYDKFKITDSEFAGVKMILKILKEADEPVIIHIVGSCRDIAIAGKIEPDLFKEKCKAIYLNAGSSREKSKLEYNVSLDPYSYRAIFEMPCTIYWMPCFEFYPVPPALDWEFTMGEYGTFYKFRQDEILQHLSEKMQKYFAYALGKVSDQRWLSYLMLPKNKEMLEYYGQQYRNMWCTAGFLHTAGKTVTQDGKIVSLEDLGIKPVFSFEPIKINCQNTGFTQWNITEEQTNRFIFRINDLDNYQQAMTSAMRSLLSTLP